MADDACDDKRTKNFLSSLVSSYDVVILGGVIATPTPTRLCPASAFRIAVHVGANIQPPLTFYLYAKDTDNLLITLPTNLSNGSFGYLLNQQISPFIPQLELWVSAPAPVAVIGRGWIKQ